MKVFPITIGKLLVSYGLFYGGLHGWEGLRGVFRYATERKYFVAPMHAYLIDHPIHGLILVDTGASGEQAASNYYRGTARLVFDGREYLVEKESGLPAQLHALGYRCEDVRTVILTHMHEDHVGGLRHFPNARVVVSRREWEARTTKLFSFLPTYYSPSFDFIKHWHLVDFTSGSFHSFDKSEDLFQDGSIRLLPTHGHTPGHMNVLISMDGYGLMVTGDSMYTLRHLATSQVQAIRFSKDAGDMQVAAIHRIRELKRQLGNVVLLIGHDHTEYQMQHILPYLAKGWLTRQERLNIQLLEDEVFHGDWTLRTARYPEYRDGLNGSKVGTVANLFS